LNCCGRSHSCNQLKQAASSSEQAITCS
jgi:hypothetical protein